MENLIIKRFDPYITKMGFEKINVNQLINKKKNIRLTLIFPHVCVEKPLVGTKLWNTVKKRHIDAIKISNRGHVLGIMLREPKIVEVENEGN